MSKSGLKSAMRTMIESAEAQASSPETTTNTEVTEVTLNFKIPKELHTRLKVYTAQKGSSLKALAIELFQEELRRNE